MKRHREKIHLWMTPIGDLFVTTETIAFDQALFSVSDCTNPRAYRPICSRYLLKKIGCECLDELTDSERESSK